MGDAGALLNGAVAQSISPDSLTLRLNPNSPLRMDSGAVLAPLTIAYQTYGALNAAKSNALLICHALSGDQHVANPHPVTGRPGWWETMVGPGRPFDTNRLFVICSNVIGGCMGSTGPTSINPETREPFGLDFPIVTIADMVRAQALLIDHLGIDTLLCVAGGSMGGMQVLQWAATYPDRVFAALPIATAARHSSQNIAFHEVGRQAIMADPDWRGGRYLVEGTRPGKGLAVARMAAHITYLSESALHRKFGRNLQDRAARTFSFDADFQVESYLRHQGAIFVERFDPNSYLYMTRAMDYFDLAADYGGSLASAFKGSRTRFCVVSFTSDWLFPTSDLRALVRALNAGGASVSFVEIETDRGHDAFLLDVPELFDTTRGFIDAAARARGVALSIARTLASLARRPVARGGTRRAGIAACSTSAAATANCCGCWPKSATSTGAASSSPSTASTIASPRDCRSFRATPTPISPTTRTTLSTMSSCRRRCRRRASRASCSSTCCASAAAPSSRCRISAIGAFGPQVAFLGRMPVTKNLSHSWYDTPNIHFCTIADFIALAREVGATIDKSVALDPRGRPLNPVFSQWAWNLFGDQAIFLLHRKR